MPPTKNDESTTLNTAVTTVEEPKNEAEREQQKVDAEAGFAAGFQETRGGERPAASASTDDTTKAAATGADATSQASDTDAAAKAKADEEAKRGRDEAERKAKEEAEAKRWEGVPVAVKEFIESQTQASKQLEQRLKSVEGRAGAALSGVEAMKGAMDAATAASKAGKEAPSKEAIAAATQSSDKWKRLKEDFPEWAEAMEEQFAAIGERIGKAGAPLDVEKVKQEVARDMDERVAGAVQQARALGRLDQQFPDWEQTVNSKEFFAWSYQGGPTADQQAAYFETRKADPGKAQAMFSGFAQQYPQWWGEKGARMASTNPSDAGTLLKSYGEHVKAQKAKADAERQKQERLEHAAPATKGASAGATRTIESEEAAFADGFKSVRPG